MPKDAVLRQLSGYDPMYEDLAENICEFVFLSFLNILISFGEPKGYLKEAICNMIEGDQNE